MKKKLIFVFILSLPIILVILIFFATHLGKIYPWVYVSGVNLGGKTPAEAAYFLSTHFVVPKDIVLIDGEQVFKIPTQSIEFSYDLQAVASEAYKIGLKKVSLPLKVRLSEEKLETHLSIIIGQIIIEPVQPSVKIIDRAVVVDKGNSGTDVDITDLKKQIKDNLIIYDLSPITVNKTYVDTRLTDEETSKFKTRAEKYLGKSLTILFENQTFNFKNQDILRLLDPKSGFKNDEIGKITLDLSKQLQREPQNPVLVFLPTQAGDGTKVKEFAPEKDGIKVKQEELNSKIVEALSKLENSEEKTVTVSVPTINTAPTFRTADINNLGIKELLGRGTSKFKGSITSRIHNISLAAGRLNGILIKPGEIFSFNEALGDVSKFTGYKEAYIIKDGKTILGDGGGVCQVSTTLFRAVLNAGLPIIERRAHAYRVYYYEQDSPPGLDATVYSPTTDLKIKNDSPGNILIQAKADTKNLTLTFELYGSKDGRVATVSKPQVSGVTAPPEDLYQDDPTLPMGVVKQIEHKAWGAKVTFDYLVKRGEEVIFEKTFVSNFRPWQAVYLKGTAPVQ